MNDQRSNEGRHMLAVGVWLEATMFRLMKSVYGASNFSGCAALGFSGETGRERTPNASSFFKFSKCEILHRICGIGKNMASRQGVAGAPTLTEAPTGCSHAVCGLVEKNEEVGTGKKMTYTLTVNVGEELPLTLASTVAVDVGARIVVALAGSCIGDVEVSAPTICDAQMLGWTGPSSAGPALLPKTFNPGDDAPKDRPKAGKATAALDKLGNVEVAEGVDALFVSKKKLTKEEKEIEKLEKAAAKGDEKAATKLQHLKVRQAIAAKRAAGEEVFTDDELEAAGLSAP